MSILVECPICHKKQSAKNKLCKCGENLDKAKRSGRVRYWINLRVDGKQRREYVGKFEDCNGYSIADAKAVDAKFSTNKREGKLFDITPDSQMTFQELSDWFLSLKKVKRMRYLTGLKIGCKRAGIKYGKKIKDGFIFHDMRRTAKTHMRKAGIDKNIRSRIFGHSNFSDMDSRYDAVDESDLVAAIDKYEKFVDHLVDHEEKIQKQTSS